MDPSTIGNTISSATSADKTGMNTLLGNQAGQQDDFLTRFRKTIGSQETVPGMASRIGNELGLPTLQGNANMLNTRMANIPQTYTAATRGVDVNANQLDQIIGRKSYEMQPSVTSANNALATAQGQRSDMMGFEQAQQAKELQPYASEQSMMADRQAREATMFSTENQHELDGLIAKLNSGVTLSEGEKNRANELSIAEKQYQGVLAGANASQNVAKIGASNLVLSGGNGASATYYNPSTGQAYNPFVNVPSR